MTADVDQESLPSRDDHDPCTQAVFATTVRQWSAVKAAYRLTVDPNEHAALGVFYRGC